MRTSSLKWAANYYYSFQVQAEYLGAFALVQRGKRERNAGQKLGENRELRPFRTCSHFSKGGHFKRAETSLRSHKQKTPNLKELVAHAFYFCCDFPPLQHFAAVPDTTEGITLTQMSVVAGFCAWPHKVFHKHVGRISALPESGGGQDESPSGSPAAAAPCRRGWGWFWAPRPPPATATTPGGLL